MKKFIVFAIILLFLILLVIGIYIISNIDQNIDETVYEIEYSEYVGKYGKEYGVPEAYIYAVIKCESNFKPDAVSSAGAKGLMQLMPATFADIQGRIKSEYPEEMITDPEVNIRCGTYYLSYLYGIFKDWDCVFAAYNAGMGNVRKWLNSEDYSRDGKLVKIPFPETDRYLMKIKNAIVQYEKLLNKREETT